MSRIMTIVVEGYIAGGADRVISQLLPFFKDYNIELLVNTALDTSVLLSYSLPENVQLIRYSWKTPADIGDWAARADSAHMVFLRRSLSVVLRYPLNMLLFLHFLNYFRKRSPDILFINNGGYPGGAGCMMASAAAVIRGNLKIIHLIHSIATPTQKLFLPLEWIVDRIVERGGCFVAVSDAVAQSLRHIRKLKVNLVTIGNGLQIAPQPLPPACEKPLKFLQVGYLDCVKNQKFSVLALGILAKKGIKNIYITFAGKETEKGYLSSMKELAKQLGVEDQIHFAGFVSDMQSLYLQYDAVLLTSIVEGMPMCILEAMRAGRAVIATSVGGVPELVEHTQTGYLLYGSGPEELAEIWMQLLERPAHLRTMGANAYNRFMEHFTLDLQAQKYLDLINKEENKSIKRVKKNVINPIAMVDFLKKN